MIENSSVWLHGPIQNHVKTGLRWLPVLIKATLQKYFINQIRSFAMSNLNIIPRKEICKQIGVSRDTLKNWIRKRNFPKPLNSSGREPLFDELCVKEWLLNNNNKDSNKGDL